MLSRDYAALRERMVSEQLSVRGINDARVLQAFRDVERHEFVPQELRPSSYQDHPLPIGEGQTISQPYMVALMTQCLHLSGDERILEIGTGSGYQAAILARLAKQVYSVERIEKLAREARSRLASLGYENVEVVTADGTLGWPGHAPYDGIIVTAAAPRIPGGLIEQLTAGGKLVIPVGTMFGQTLAIAEKTAREIVVREICGCVFVPLVGKEGWKEGASC
jgi:protein-L-isoaspartate(D-aspartate) O-methyltransferase